MSLKKCPVSFYVFLKICIIATSVIIEKKFRVVNLC